MKLTFKALKLLGATPELDMFWVESPEDDFGGDFEPPRLQGPSLFTPGVQLEKALWLATRIYPIDKIQVVDATIQA